MDVVHEGAKGAERRRWSVLGVILTLLVCVWMVGCPATTQSVLRPEEKVDAEGLRREATIIDSYVAQLDIAASDIESKVARRKKIIDTIGVLGVAVTTGSPSAAAGVAGLIIIGSLFVGGGAVLDKRRTNKLLAAKKSGVK